MKAKRKITTPLKKEQEGGLIKAFDFLANCKRYKDDCDWSGLGSYLMGQYTTVFNASIPSAMLCLIEARIPKEL